MDHFINTNITDLAAARSVSLLNPTTPRPFPVLAYGDAGTDRVFFHNDGTIESWSGSASYGLRVTLGDVDAGPFGGTYTLTSGTTTAALDYDTDATALETALNQLTGISTEGGVDVTGAFPNFLVAYRAVGVVATAITASGALLTPDSGIGVTVLTTGDASTRQLTAITLRRQPICSVTSWTPIVSPYAGWSGTLTTNTEGALALLMHEGEQVGEYVQAVTTVQVEVLDPSGQYLTRYQAPFTLRAKNIDIASTSATPLPSIVTSVGLSMPSIFTVSGSPVTSSGTLTATLATQSANRVFSGPTTGAAAAPTFRALVNDDIPSALTGKTYNGLTVTTTTGTLTLANGSTLATSGAFSTTLTATGATNVTLPTTGTIATLAGAESLTNKKLGSLTSNGIVTTSGGDGTLSVTVTTGSGSVVLATSPTLTTPVLGAATATSLNGLTVTTTTGTFTLTSGKTLSVSNTLTLAGTDGTTMTFPTTTATIARTDAGQTFTGNQVFSGTVSAADAGANSERFGASAAAAGSNSTALGNGASAAGNSSVAIGRAAVAGVTQSVAIGHSATANDGTTSTAVGYATVVGLGGVALGANASSNVSRGIAIGSSSTVSGNSGIAIGGAGVAGTTSVLVGVDGSAAGLGSTALGYAANAAHNNATAVGMGATTTKNNQVVLGNSSVTELLLPNENIVFGTSGKGILGTTTNDSADAGNVGQIVSALVASGSAGSLTTATAANVTSISLTAGDWDVEGNVNVTLGTATLTAQAAGISTTSATLPTDGSEVYSGLQLTTTNAVDSITLPRKRISVASTTTVYLVGRATFSAGTAAAFGAITARRVR